jgi:hypothetical protein
VRVFSYRGGGLCKSVEVQRGYLKFPLSLIYTYKVCLLQNLFILMLHVMNVE